MPLDNAFSNVWNENILQLLTLGIYIFMDDIYTYTQCLRYNMLKSFIHSSTSSSTRLCASLWGLNNKEERHNSNSEEAHV